jgi:chromosome segregation ATPase
MTFEEYNKPVPEYQEKSSSAGWIAAILLILILTAAGFIFYWFGYKPIQENALRMMELETRVQQNQQMLTQQLDSLETRLEGMENDLEYIQESFSILESNLEKMRAAQGDLAETQTSLAGDLESLQTDLAGMSELTQELQAISDLRATIEANIGSLEDEISTAAMLIDEFSLRTDSISDEVAGFSDRWQELENEVQLLKVMDLINSSRELLLQGDIAEARAKILEARDQLEQLGEQVSDFQADALLDITTNLEDVLAEISEAPSTAANILEQVWKLLFSGLPEE